MIPEDPAMNMSRRTLLIGTLFLVIQLAFAAWRFGPHRVPGLRHFVPPPEASAALFLVADVTGVDFRLI
jgi:hypothetical protein